MIRCPSVDPARDAAIYYDNNQPKKRLGCCEQCGHDVFIDYAYEDDAPLIIHGEKILLHEGCLMKYAKNNWRLEEDE